MRITKTMTIVSALCVAVMMTACGKSDNNKLAAETMNEADYSFPTELTDNLFDCRIQIDGEVLTVPTTLCHLHQAGWTNDEDEYPKIHIDGSEDTTIAVGVGWGSPWMMGLNKDGGEIGINMINYTDTIAECLTDEGAARIDVESLSCLARDNVDKTIVLPKGITLNVSTAEDVIAAYGEPRKIKKTNGGSYYIYYEGETLEDHTTANCYISLLISSGGGPVEQIYIKAMKETAEDKTES